MVNALTGMGYANKVTKQEINFNNKVFRDCEKNVKKAEVRDADWGLYAAQTCLAKDLVTASPEEANFIMTKMDYLQNKINENMNQDQRICREDEEDKRSLIATKADAEAKKIPARAELIRTTTDSAREVIDSSAKLVQEFSPAAKTAGKVLDLAA